MRKSLYMLTLTILVIFCCCKKLGDFNTTNNNPAATSNTSTSGLLTNVLSNLILDPLSDQGKNQGIYWVGLYCQYFSERIGTGFLMLCSK